ncbi:MAG: hypothetical protein ACJA0H_000077 [Francisellaceae bacterium]|jgi:hypothetical protein
MIKKIIYTSIACALINFSYASDQHVIGGLTVGLQAGALTPAASNESGGTNGFGGATLGFDYPIDTHNHVSLGLETGFSYANKTASDIDSTKVGKTFILPIFATLKTVLPLGLSFVVKAGSAYTQQDTTNLIDNSTSNLSKFRPMFAGGIGWQFEQLNVTSLYSRYIGENNVTSDTPLSMNLFSIQLTYTFEVQKTQWWIDNEPDNIDAKKSQQMGF